MARYPTQNRPDNSDNRSKMAPTPQNSRGIPDLAALEASVVPTISPLDALPEEGPSPENLPEQAPETPGTPPKEAQKPVSEAKMPENAAPAEDDVDDERFKGKSKKDIYEALKAREQTLGRQGEELGFYRKHLDDRLKERAEGKQPVKPPAASDEDDATVLNRFLTSPKKVIGEIRQQAVKDFVDLVTTTTSQNTMNAEIAKHQQVFATSEFKNWLTMESGLDQATTANMERTPAGLAAIARMYNAAQGVQAPTTPVAETSEPVTVVPQKRVVPVGPAVGVKTGGAQRTQPVTFTHYDLAKMEYERPDEYAARQPEIIRAYQEGRVK